MCRFRRDGKEMMTRTELIDAYIRGDIDRRGFVKRLTALGVSAGAAMAYAVGLGQDAAASPTRNMAGFVSRAQTADAEYGVAVVIEDVVAAIQGILTQIQAITDGLNGILGDFNAGDFAAAGLEESDFELVRNIVAQLTEQQDALSAAMAESGGASRTSGAFRTFRRGGATFRLQTSGTLLQRLTEVANALNQLAGVYAAVIPNLDNDERRQLVTEIGLATARYAALVSRLAGVDPVPGAFEQPIDPDEV